MTKTQKKQQEIYARGLEVELIQTRRHRIINPIHRGMQQEPPGVTNQIRKATKAVEQIGLTASKIMSDYLKEQQRKFEDYAESYRKETNEVFRELTRQLILVDAAFLSVLAIVFGNGDFTKKISICDRCILIHAFIFLTLSLIFGIGQFFIDYFYFKKWSCAKFAIVEGIVKEEINKDNISEKVKEMQKNIPNESCTLFVWLQVGTLILAIILLVVLVTKLLCQT